MLNDLEPAAQQHVQKRSATLLSVLVGRAKRAGPGVLVGFGAVSTLFAVSLLLWRAQVWDRRTSAWQEESAALRTPASSMPTSVISPQDFVMRLPPIPRVDAFLDDARRWGAEGAEGNGVEVTSASVRSTASQGRPVSVDVQLEVRGHYPALKDWVNQLQGRYREAALLSMDMRASSDEEGGLNGSLQWRLYARGAETLAARAPSGALP